MGKMPMTRPYRNSDYLALIWSLNASPDGQGNASQIRHQFREGIRPQGLEAVLQRFLRIGMNFHHYPVRAGCNRRLRNGRNKIPFAGAVAGVNDNRQMTQSLY